MTTQVASNVTTVSSILSKSFGRIQTVGRSVYGSLRSLAAPLNLTLAQAETGLFASLAIRGNRETVARTFAGEADATRSVNTENPPLSSLTLSREDLPASMPLQVFSQLRMFKVT